MSILVYPPCTNCPSTPICQFTINWFGAIKVLLQQDKVFCCPTVGLYISRRLFLDKLELNEWNKTHISLSWATYRSKKHGDKQNCVWANRSLFTWFAEAEHDKILTSFKQKSFPIQHIRKTATLSSFIVWLPRKTGDYVMYHVYYVPKSATEL